MEVGSIASVSVIVTDPAAAGHLYRDTLHVPFEGGEGDYVFTEKLSGVKHFAPVAVALIPGGTST